MLIPTVGSRWISGSSGSTTSTSSRPASAGGFAGSSGGVISLSRGSDNAESSFLSSGAFPSQSDPALPRYRDMFLFVYRRQEEMQRSAVRIIIKEFFTMIFRSEERR